MASEKIVYSRFRYPLALIILVCVMISGYLTAITRYTEAAAFIVAGVLTFVIMFRLYDNLGRTVTFFFNSLKNNDTSQQYPVNLKNKTLVRLHQSMNEANRHFQSIRLQSEYNENFYKELIRHSATGLLVLNQDNRVELINRSACKHAGIPADSSNPMILKIKNPLFYEAICNLKAGQDMTYRQIIGNDYQLLTFRASLLMKNRQTLKLISVHDIRHEMESKELESYRKLISVLTHEIMNQVTPLTSVSKTLQALFADKNSPAIISGTDSTLATVQKGLQLIEEQSTGLTSFINNYRKISKIPTPVIQIFNVDEWIDQLRIVYADKMKENEILFRISKDNQISNISADKNLMNQVIINLVNNATEAVLENPVNREINISISSYQSNRVRIKVFNNGPDILPEIRERIFVPFFTTKESGSGIGLSICKEIIKLHRGSLTLLSSKGGETVFMVEI